MLNWPIQVWVIERIYLYRILLLSSSNRKYQPFPLLSYFSHGCVPKVVVPAYCVDFTYIPGKLRFAFFNFCTALWRVPIVEYIMARWLDSFVCTLHYLIIIIMHTIWRYWTSKIFVRYILSSVCLRLSELSFMQYMGLCVFSSPFSLMMIVRKYVLHLITITNSELWPICHCLWLGHDTMVCAEWLFIFLYIWFISPQP